MPHTAANYIHYVTITCYRGLTFPTHRCLSAAIPSPTHNQLLLSQDVTYGLVSKCDTVELLAHFSALHIYLFCDPSLCSALVHYRQKEVNQLMMQCHWRSAQARGREKKDTLKSAKILQTCLPLFRLWNEMQHHKFCLNLLAPHCLCFLGRASDNVQSRTTKTCTTS